ncbi:MAG: hypothetical protein MZV65_12705 [Chromatiales bacterium]|nr:hypothetical protein [Chromatiales bacterium]
MRIDDRTRLLILNVPGLSSALLVHEVVGLRHFDEEQERQDVTVVDDPAMAARQDRVPAGECACGGVRHALAHRERGVPARGRPEAARPVQRTTEFRAGNG